MKARRHPILRRLGRKDRLLAAFAISVYLAATFLPCGASEGIRVFASAAHAMVMPSIASAEQASPHSHADHSDHTGAVDAAHLTDAVAVSREVEHADSEHDAHRLGGDQGAESTLALTAQCPCGCKETRGAVGGGAARLGAVIPGASVATLLALPVVHSSSTPSARFTSSAFDIDPVPI